MAYLGKEYSFVREENIEDLINAVDYLDFFRLKPSQTIEKNGDTYKLIYKPLNLDFVFKSGVPFTETIRGTLQSNTTTTVNGDTIVTVQDFGSLGTLTTTREYSGDELKMTLKSSKWDGAAYVYLKA